MQWYVLRQVVKSDAYSIHVRHAEQPQVENQLAPQNSLHRQKSCSTALTGGGQYPLICARDARAPMMLHTMQWLALFATQFVSSQRIYDVLFQGAKASDAVEFRCVKYFVQSAHSLACNSRFFPIPMRS